MGLLRGISDDVPAAPTWTATDYTAKTLPVYKPTSNLAVEGAGAYQVRNVKAEPVPTGPADGSSPASAISIVPSEVLNSVGVDDILNAARPDAYVLAVKGSIGVQDIPGWDKIPGLKNLGKDANVGYLAATLSPFSGNVSDVAKTTMFLSLTIPGHKPIVLTVKLSDMNFEAGTPIKNQPLKDGKVLLFSNMRAGVSGHDTGKVGDDEAGVSINGGILLRMDGVKKAVKSIKDLVKTVLRSAEGAEAVAAVADAGPSGGTSLVAGAGSIIATELGRGAIFKSLDKADWYAGLAWRGSTSIGLPNDGKVTVQAQKGALKGQWITFNLKDLDGDIFDSKAPDFAAPDRDWMISQGATEQTADIISKAWDKDWSVQPLIEQMAENRNTGPSGVMDWLNEMKPEQLHRYVSWSWNLMPEPDKKGLYSTTPSDRLIVPLSIPDLLNVASLNGSFPHLPSGAPDAVRHSGA